MPRPPPSLDAIRRARDIAAARTVENKALAVLFVELERELAVAEAEAAAAASGDILTLARAIAARQNTMGANTSAV